MIHSRDFFIKIYNGIYIWNQQELLYKMVYKLYDLVEVGRKPPLNGHGPLNPFAKIPTETFCFKILLLFIYLIFFKLSRILIRTCLKNFSIVFLFPTILFFILPAFTEHGQTSYDKASESIVVQSS